MTKNPLEFVEEGRQFWNEVQVEFKKVTWPSQKETVAGAVSVVVIAIFVGLALSVVDFSLGRLLTTFLQ